MGAKKKASKGPAHRHSIEPVAGGFMSTTDHHPAPGAAEPINYADLQTKKFHKTAEEAGSHASKMMGGMKLASADQAESDPAVGGTSPDQTLGA